MPHDEIIIFSLENDQRFNEDQKPLNLNIENIDSKILSNQKTNSEEASKNACVTSNQDPDSPASDDYDMSERELSVLIEEKKSEIVNIQNQRGNRYNLLQPVIKSLLQTKPDAEEPVKVSLD